MAKKKIIDGGFKKILDVFGDRLLSDPTLAAKVKQITDVSEKAAASAKSVEEKAHSIGNAELHIDGEETTLRCVCTREKSRFYQQAATV